MRYLLRGSSVMLAAVFLLLPASPAQSVPEPCTIAGLARRADLVFRGTVLSVEHVPAEDGIPTVRVIFLVEDAARGANPGDVLTIRQWQPPWMPDSYRPGTLWLMLLHAPSDTLGLTSPVGGDRGRIPVSDGQPALPQLDGDPSATPAEACPAPKETPRRAVDQ